MEGQLESLDIYRRYGSQGTIDLLGQHPTPFGPAQNPDPPRPNTERRPAVVFAG